jgi:FtsP/CotA-like multicopper oxidase with cupredoxin domain
LGAVPENNMNPSQRVPSLITAAQGQKILLRVSSIATVRFYTLTSPGIPMTVVGRDAKILRSSAGTNMFYNTNSITIGGGESADIILDTQNIAPGTYFLYTSNLEELSNNQQDFGGMMTEIVIQ